MIRIRPALAAAGAILLLAGCASGPQNAGDAPEWAKNLESVYPRETYLTGRGSGASRAEAEAAALAALARIFSLEIESSTGAQESFLSEDGVTRETRELTTETFVRSTVQLFSVRYDNSPWWNPRTKEWETVAYIDRDEAWKIYEPRLRREELIFLDIYNGAEKEADPIRSFAMYRGVQTFYRQNFEPLRIFAEILRPEAAADFAGTDTLLAELSRKADAARSRAVIFIDCPNDFENRVTQAFEKHINAEGIRVTKNRSEATGIFTVTIEENQSIQKEENLTMYVFNPSLQAALNGKSGALFSYNPPKIERTVAMKSDGGKRGAYQALAASVEASFPAEFHNRLASFVQVE